MPATKDAVIHIWVTPELRNQFKAYCARQGLSMQQWIEEAMRRATDGGLTAPRALEDT